MIDAEFDFTSNSPGYWDKQPNGSDFYRAHEYLCGAK